MKNKANIFDIPSWGIAVLFGLFIPVFVIHLGRLAFIEDEAIRAMVAYEMLQTSNYLIPTINGDLYYAKPPLYNWIIAGVYHLTGVANEWTTRLPNIGFLALFAFLIYQFSKDLLGKNAAILNAAAFLTCGRILFWDSSLGLIDISYSLITYIVLIGIWRWRYSPWKKNMLAYGLSTVGYLMKGFPSPVFLGISLLVFHIWKRKEIKPHIPSHLAGLFLFIIVITSYYWIYSSQTQAVESALSSLLDQSTRRTVLDHGILHTIQHVFSYPFENVYHFLPWSLFSVFFFHKEVFQKLLTNKAWSYLALIFLANISVYWISPGVYPRYILMLVPIYFTCVFYALTLHVTLKTTWVGKIKFGVSVLLLLCISMLLLSNWHPEMKVISSRFEISIAAALLISFLLYFLQKGSLPTLFGLVLALCVIRIWFNLSVIPSRTSHDLGTQVRDDAKRIALKYPDIKLYGKARMDRTSSFYLATARASINERSTNIESGEVYILDTFIYPHSKLLALSVDSMKIREYKRMAYIIQKK